MGGAVSLGPQKEARSSAQASSAFSTWSPTVECHPGASHATSLLPLLYQAGHTAWRRGLCGVLGFEEVETSDGSYNVMSKIIHRDFPGGPMVKNPPPPMQGT